MQNKLCVGLICGGTSNEHEISLLTAKNVLRILNPEKYDVVPIYIDKRGHWHHFEAKALLNKSTKELLQDRSSPVKSLVSTTSFHAVRLPETKLDVVFPLVHGPCGEDGTIQGFLKLARIPYVGAQVLGSAIGMDKDVMKRLLRDASIPVARFKAICEGDRPCISMKEIIDELGLPLFVKPANMGSSVGISKARNAQELEQAIIHAFRYDRKILIEESVVGREVECAVLGNETPIASVIGEVVTKHEFYSYDAKYFDDALTLHVPAKIPHEVAENARALALKVFKALCCEGMARVDFFLRSDMSLVVNEINTIPGFTHVSMYPMLWEASGISYSELIDRLLQLALDRYQQEIKIENSNV